jgi:hypothetical protein
MGAGERRTTPENVTVRTGQTRDVDIGLIGF